MFEAYSAGDMDAFRELHDPDVIGRMPEGWPEPGFVGREAVMRQFEQLRETFDATSVRPISDFIDAGDRVVVRLAYHGEGHGPEMNFEMTQVITVRNGKILYREYFWDHAEALEAVGLSAEAMSRENVELVRQGLDAVNRRDRAAWLALCDPELENIPPQDWPESDPIRGGEPVFDFLAVEAQDAWEEDSSPFEYVELIDAGNDRVVADMRREVRGKASGASVAWRYWQVVTFRNGKVLRIEWFGERAEALEAVGLSE